MPIVYLCCDYVSRARLFRNCITAKKDQSEIYFRAFVVA
jgi:hypothetical protein